MAKSGSVRIAVKSRKGSVSGKNELEGGTVSVDGLTVTYRPTQGRAMVTTLPGDGEFDITLNGKGLRFRALNAS